MTEKAEEKNLKEAFLNDKFQGGGQDSARINTAGQLKTQNWKKKTEYKQMTEKLEEFKKGTFTRKIKECQEWAKKEEICAVCGCDTCWQAKKSGRMANKLWSQVKNDCKKHEVNLLGIHKKKKGKPEKDQKGRNKYRYN